MPIDFDDEIIFSDYENQPSILSEEQKAKLKIIAKEVVQRNMNERWREKTKGMYDGPNYDEEYLKRLENLPKGYKFTEEQLDQITDRAYPGIKREEHLWNYDRQDKLDVMGYDKRYRAPRATEERVRKMAQRNYGPYSPDNSPYKNFYDLAMGLITPREFDRRIFKRMLRRRYEK